MIPVQYQFFMLFAFTCISIAMTVMYSLEKHDSIKQEADHKKYTKKFFITMIVFWCLLGVSFTIFVWKNKKAYFRLRGLDKEMSAVIPFKFQMILVILCLLTAIVMTIVDMAVEKKCIDDKDPECHTNNYLITLIVFWGLFGYFSILFLIIHYDWIIPSIKGYFKFAKGQKRFRNAKAEARRRKRLAQQRLKAAKQSIQSGISARVGNEWIDRSRGYLDQVKQGGKNVSDGLLGLGRDTLPAAAQTAAGAIQDRYNRIYS